jgi:hypothetical protein
MLKKILINSQDRQSGTPYDFKVKLPIRNTQKIHSLMVSKAMLANTWYNVKNKAIVLYYPVIPDINSSIDTEYIPFPDGNYTIPTLVSKINEMLANINPLLGIDVLGPLTENFHPTTLTYDNVLGKAYLWNSFKLGSPFPNYFQLDATAPNSILKLLNFSGKITFTSNPTPLNFIVASSGFVNISPNNYVLIKSSALRHQETYEPETTNPNDFNNIIATVPITRNFGEAIMYENTDTENMIKYSSHVPNQIDVKLCFYNNETAFINTEWSFELLIKYE